MDQYCIYGGLQKNNMKVVIVVQYPYYKLTPDYNLNMHWKGGIHSIRNTLLF